RKKRIEIKNKKGRFLSFQKALLIGFFLIGTLSLSYPANGNLEQVSDTSKTNTNVCLIENTTFQHGEEITYKVFYNWNFVWLPAGEVVFKVNEEEDLYHFSAHGRTYKSYEWFFKVRDKYDTYVSKKSLLPNVSIRDVREGKYRLYDEVVFDHAQNKAISKRGKTSDDTEEKEYQIESCVHDILSIIYFARNVDFRHFQKGDNFPISVFMDKETWPLSVQYKGKNPRKKVKGRGFFKTLQFSPEVIEGGVFQEGTEMSVWVSDDDNRIPLLIESPVSVGSVKIVLKDYKGLKHDFTAHVK
ncbi:MAG: DUF3108 domain-containing protein, partial [Bacteroidetes bacterium]|nr:DUF3108 domain-containing protein [Bacteroidota bacterium]